MSERATPETDYNCFSATTARPPSGDYELEVVYSDFARRLERERDQYKSSYTEAVEACLWMHDDKTLELPLGSTLTTDGVAKLKEQRDKAREQRDDLSTEFARAEQALDAMMIPRADDGMQYALAHRVRLLGKERDQLREQLKEANKRLDSNAGRIILDSKIKEKLQEQLRLANEDAERWKRLALSKTTENE